MTVHHRAGRCCGTRLAAHGHMLFEIPPRKLAHGGTSGRLHRFGHGLIARLDPGDDQRRPLTRLLRAEHSVPAHRDPLRSPRSPGLGDIDLAARGIDPHPESRELVIPEHRVLLDLQLLDRAVRERLVFQLRHVIQPHAASVLPGPRWAPMLSPTRVAASFSASRIRCAYRAVVPTFL